MRPISRQNTSIFDYGRHWDGWSSCAMLENTQEGGCRILKPGRPADIMVIGDSHAGHLAAGLREQFTGSPYNVVVLLHAGCFPVFPTVMGQERYFSCPQGAIDQALQAAISSTETKVVVLAGYANYYVLGARFPAPPEPAAKTLANGNAVERALDATFERLERANKRVIFVLDVPELEKDPRLCLDRRLPFIPFRCTIDIDRSRVEDRSAGSLELIRKVAMGHPSVRLFSAIDALCDTTMCHGTETAELLYASRDHLTPAGSRRVVRGLAEQLRAVLAAQ